MARTRLTRITLPRQVTDPFTLKFHPPEKQLLKWKDDIARKNQHMKGTFVYAENAQGCFDISSLQTMLKLNRAKSIKTAVYKEIEWFAASYDILATVHQPPASSIEQFNDLLYSVRYDKVISPLGMSPNELSTICLDRWLSCDPIRWLMKSLNGSQSHTVQQSLTGSCLQSMLVVPLRVTLPLVVIFKGVAIGQCALWTVGRSFMVPHWDGLSLMGSLTRFTHSSG